jgi:hypothetical protein
LEVKAAPPIDDKDEIGKDVSAMANASVGTIIHGKAEVDDKPHYVEPIRFRYWIPLPWLSDVEQAREILNDDMKRD